uniref:Uncharacterized protein n=1 Tax=Sphaerodactylus townsendi TaxID=933632 RepID=A0ACB8EQB7_9SAUR
MPHLDLPSWWGPGQHINCKNVSSKLLLVTYDHTGMFINTETGYFSCNDNAFVLQELHFFQAMDMGIYIPDRPTLTIDGMTIPPVVLADSTFPRRKWLVMLFRLTNEIAKGIFVLENRHMQLAFDIFSYFHAMAFLCC